MKLHFYTGMAIFAISANAVSLQPGNDQFGQDTALDWLMTQTDADAGAETQTTTNLEALAAAEAEYFDKVGKFAEKAYQELKPTLEKVQKFAGPHADQILGMTPMGQMLGLGPVGSISSLRQYANQHRGEALHHHGRHHHGSHSAVDPYTGRPMPRDPLSAPLPRHDRHCTSCAAKRAAMRAGMPPLPGQAYRRSRMSPMGPVDPIEPEVTTRVLGQAVNGGPKGSQCCCGSDQLAGMYPQVYEGDAPELAQLQVLADEDDDDAFGFTMTQTERADGTTTTEYAPL